MDQSSITASQPLFVVGIGASAGGLNALEQFFDAVPADTGMAFVVIQHLSPDFKSLMDDLLSRHTEMPIHRVIDGMELQSGHVYLIPPRTQMTVQCGHLFLTERQVPQRVELPIDVFFRSLAEDARERAIGVILSGTGSDGSRGAQLIHENGGCVIAQAPESAQFDGMPRSAIATGKVDFILSPDRIPSLLLEYCNNPAGARASVTQTLQIIESEGEFAEIFALLRKHYRLDFSKYKAGTVGRRITRRMEFRQISNVSDYSTILSGDLQELELVYKDLLIGVTEFLRDRQAFDLIESKVLPEIFSNLAEGQDLRVWSAACATGEEAFSLAILLAEKAAELEFTGKITVFATDVHKSSLETASHGLYSTESLANVSEARLNRFFRKDGADSYRVTNDLRKLVVFAPHNVLYDPPFTKIDLICCRNLLIYFQPEVQERTIGLFHFALKTGGVLFLGSSEGLGSFSGEFDVVSAPHRLFRKIRDLKLAIDLDSKFANKEMAPSAIVLRNGQPRTVSIDRQLLQDYDAILRKHVPPGVLINGDGEIVHYFGNVSDYLHIEGRNAGDVMQMATGNLRIVLSSMLQRMSRAPQSYLTKNVRIGRGGAEHMVDVRIDPIPADRGHIGHFHIYFEQVRTIEPLAIPLPTGDEADELQADSINQYRQHVQDLESELESSRESLQTTIEELQTTNEELQATNEEMLASNEELQSTNEELHSVNEELYSVNAEFERKNAELKEVNQDYENLLRSTQVGVVFIDRNMRIRKFNPAINRFFKLLPQDIGRPIDHIAYQLPERDELIESLREVIESGEVREHEIRPDEDTWLLKRALPFRTETSQVEGAVLTFIDVSRLKHVETSLKLIVEELEIKVNEGTEGLKEAVELRRAADLAAKESLEKYRALFSSFPLGIVVCDESGRIVEVNRQAEGYLGFRLGSRYEDCLFTKGREFILPDGTTAPLESFAHVRALREDRAIENIEMGITSDSEPIRWFNISAAPIHVANRGVAVIYHDISARRQAEQARRESEMTYRALVDSLPDIVMRFDAEGRCQYASGNCVELFETSELTGQTIKALGLWDDSLTGILSNDRLIERELVSETHRGRVNYNWRYLREGHRGTSARYFMAIGRDTTARHRAEQEYHLLFNEMHDGLAAHEVTFDEHGFPSEYYFLTANPAFERLTGLRTADVIGKGLAEVLPDISYRWVDTYNKVITTGAPALFDGYLAAVDRYFEVKTFRVSNNQCASLFFDITDRTRAAEERAYLTAQLQQSQKMESVGRLAGGIAHDFNNLLTVVIGQAQLLGGSLPPEGPVRDKLNAIVSAGQHAASLTGQLLAYSRKQVLQLTSLDLNQLLREVLNMLARLVGEDIEIILELRALPGRVQADRHQLQQVILNLVVNARDAMPTGGQMIISSYDVEIDERYVQTHTDARSGSYVVLSIRDNGVGIEAGAIKQIFEPFFTTKALGKGTGLGLSTAHGIVVQSGGHIEVDSAPGFGTTFRVYLPKADEPKAGEKLKAQMPHLGGTETILVVEDQPDVLEYTVQVVESLGYRVLGATDVTSALELVDREINRIDLVLTDVVMPKGGGAELVERVRILQPGIKVMFMSGYPDDILNGRRIDASSIAFVQKPFSPESLALAIRTVLDS